MSLQPMKLVQCWDDGVTTDARLVALLRRHGAKATFNLNAGLHERHRKRDWVYRGTDVWKLGLDEMRDVYRGFAIANHSLTHPHLEQLPIEEVRAEIVEGRDRLEQFFGQAITGFAYPFGTYNDAVVSVLRESGHVYARTVECATQPFPPNDPLAFHPNCHFLAPDFWTRYEQARESGVFYFWGHSYEIVTESMWAAFEATIVRLGEDPQNNWYNVADLFGVPGA